MLPCLREAPITAMEWGLSRALSEAMAATFSRAMSVIFVHFGNSDCRSDGMIEYMLWGNQCGALALLDRLD